MVSHSVTNGTLITLKSLLLSMIFWGGEVENSATDLVELKMDGFIYSCTNMNNF